jgi:hypothetical protein
MSEATQPTQNVPAEVRIPFLNDITQRYKIEFGPISSNKGGGRHHYYISAVNDAGEVDFKTEIHFQEGALNEHPCNGVLSIVLLAILKDHFQSFQEGEFANRETATAITQLEDVMYRVCARADERAARGVLGKHQK